MYSLVGRSAETIMVNSSWTESHILSLWKCPFKTHRVYPPCEVSHLKNLQHAAVDDTIVIMSISQFRPEKDHPLQLQVKLRNGFEIIFPPLTHHSYTDLFLLLCYLQALYELRTLLLDDEPTWNRVRKKCNPS